MVSFLDSPRIDVFNPRRLSDRQIAALSTGRDDLLAELHDTIIRNTQGGSIQHVALIAPRGYGKSFLLRQLRMETEGLAREGWPVAYAHLPEELPNVSSIAALIDHMRRFMVGDLTGGIGHFRDEPPDALEKALAALDAALNERFGPGQGLVVAAIENFDVLLDKLAARTARRRSTDQPKLPKGLSSGDWTVELALRGLIERRSNRLMLVISATRNIRNDHPSHPLFQWIQEIRLEPWTDLQVLEYALRRRKLSKGEEALLSAKEQIQLKALAEFTSGAPRMIAVLVDHLLEQDLDHATLNLAALIDELTPYYQDRLYTYLGGEALLVFDALLRGGEPASQTEVAARFAEKRLPQSRLAEVFKKLQTERLVVGVREIGGKKKATLYRAADRIMAYWYKQRQAIGHDPATNGISHFEEAVELLVGWFSRDDLRLEADRFARRGRREEAALLSYLGRHGLPKPGDSVPNRRGPRKHLTFGFLMQLELLARLLDPADRAEAGQIMEQLQAGGTAELLAGLKREVQSGKGRREIFLLCALAVVHALRGADHSREDERAEAALTQALAVAEADADAGIVVRALFAMVQWQLFGDTEKSLADSEASFEWLGRAATLEARLCAHWNKAFANYHRKDYEDGLTQARLASALACELELPPWECRNQENMTYCLHELGRKEEALDHAWQAVEQALLAQDIAREAEALNLVSWLFYQLDRHEESLDTAEQAAERALIAEDYEVAANAFLRQSWSLAVFRRYDEALAAARKAAEYAEKACNPIREKDAILAEIDALNGLTRHQEALDAAHRLYEWAERNRNDEARAEALFQQGIALSYLKRWDGAVAVLRQALEANPGNEAFRCRVFTWLGYSLGLAGQHERAIETLAEAVRLGSKLEDSDLPINLDNLLIYANRLPRTADYTSTGTTILTAFADLAQLNIAKALNFLPLAVRVAVALDRYDSLQAVLRLGAQNEVMESRRLGALAWELNWLAESQGRAKTYAALVAVLSALTSLGEENKLLWQIRASLLRNLSMYLRDAGLLRDVADYLQEQDGTTLRAQIDTLRSRALALENTGPAALERVDPDLARLFQVVEEIGHLPTRLPNANDPDLNVRPCVVAPVGRATFAGLELQDASPETAALFGELAPKLGIANLGEFDGGKLRAAALPFLPGATLLLLPHRGGEIAVPFVLHPGGLALARRQNDWIYDLMERRSPLDLSESAEATARLAVYARFFLTVINGTLGAFRLIDRAEKIPWTESATAVDKESISTLIQPMARLANQGDSAMLRWTVIFQDALFHASTRIQANGLIEICDEELLAEDLAIRFGPAATLVADH